MPLCTLSVSPAPQDLSGCQYAQKITPVPRTITASFSPYCPLLSVFPRSREFLTKQSGLQILTAHLFFMSSLCSRSSHDDLDVCVCSRVCIDASAGVPAVWVHLCGQRTIFTFQVLASLVFVFMYYVVYDACVRTCKRVCPCTQMQEARQDARGSPLPRHTLLP